MTENNNNNEIDITSDIVIVCPHCNDQILIEKLNCRIFRHGVYKDTNQQILPHLSKEICDSLAQNNSIYGCGKPFRIIKANSQFVAIVCDYI